MSTRDPFDPTLTSSARGWAFGQRVVDSHRRHGRVGEVIGRDTFGARAVGAMLDALLSGPGATLELVDAREITPLGRAAIGFEVRRADRRHLERVWVIVDDLDREPRARMSTSTMTLDLLLATP